MKARILFTVAALAASCGWAQTQNAPKAVYGSRSARQPTVTRTAPQQTAPTAARPPATVSPTSTPRTAPTSARPSSPSASPHTNKAAQRPAAAPAATHAAPAKTPAAPRTTPAAPRTTPAPAAPRTAPATPARHVAPGRTYTAPAETRATPARTHAPAKASTPPATRQTTPAAIHNVSATPYSGTASSGSPDEGWIQGRLAIGLLYSTFSLTHGDRPANREEDFLGNINELNADHKNNFAPFVSYRPIDYLALGLSYAHIEASTKNFNNHLGDGNAILKGPVFTAELAYPCLNKRLIPHAGIGFAMLSGDFQEDTWWHLGYANPKAWESYGSPSTRTMQNYYRYIDVDDESALYFTAGLSYRPFRHLLLDVSYRALDLDPSCEFGYDYGPDRGGKEVLNEGDFDMSCRCWLFSIGYVF